MIQAMRYETVRLPVEMTSFVGRRQETADIKDALANSRLVTLTGVGGVGKSRLALHVATDLRRAFPDGVWVVELATVHDPSLVAQAVALGLDLRDQSVRDAETVLTDYLADRSALLVLDNCEHLLEVSSELVNTLLAVAPKLRVLATSREPLRSSAEHVWPVPPLSVPGPDEPASRRHEALTLFEERVARSRPKFAITPENEAAVTRLCQRLDGIPLAIELAAVQMRLLSAEQILNRLEDRFRLLTQQGQDISPRHQTLRATVDWSFELCTEAERTVWARCSVFAGEFDVDAAEYVCAGGGLSEGDVFAAVAGLVDKSVLIPGEGGYHVRYRMLETIRQYGRERLVSSGEEDELRRRHRDHYLRVAVRADKDSSGTEQDRLVEDLVAERDNMVAALEYSFSAAGESKVGLRMASALWFCWIGCGFLRSGRDWLDRGLAEDREPSPERARALWLNGWISFLQGDHVASPALTREGRELAREIGDESALTFATQFLGDLQMWAGDLDQGIELLDEALNRHRLSRSWTAPALLIFALRAQAAGLAGNTDLAMALLEECHTLSEARGERWALSWTEWNVGVGWWSVGDPVNAAEHARKSLRHKDELHDRLGIACCVELLAWVAVAEGDAHRAAVLFGGVARLWETIGRPLFGSYLLLGWSQAAYARSREALGNRGFEAATEEGEELSPEALIDYALDIKAAAEPAEQKSVLTKREREVAELVAEGLSNKAIANRLVIARRTAESHLDHILTKLGFTSRTQIAVWVAEQRKA
jgi:predicted ATPase/DNA-binding CsgD family transcriptional regulator